MKTIKELLIIIKENINRIGFDTETNRHMETGLCSLINRLEKEGIINELEYYRLINYLQNNPPANWHKRKLMTFPESDYREAAFWFKPCVKLPRYNWLVKHIKLNN